MSSISGQLRIGEATNAIRAIRRRQIGSRFLSYIILAVLLSGGWSLGTFVSRPDSTPVRLLGITAALLIYIAIQKRLILASFRKRMVDRGFPPELRVHMEITPSFLIYEIGDVRHTANWSAVTELFISRKYWVFLVQSSPWFAPQRFFTNEDAERAFVAEALAQMSDAARLRSAGAVAFAKATSTN